MAKAKLYSLSFLKKEQVAKDTYTFYFKRGKFPDFIPGQYLRLEIPHPADERGTTRYFTISSSPRDKKQLTITTKIIKSTFKKALFALKPRTKVNAFGPMGWFLLPKDESFEKVFISGGIGITPFRSLLTTLQKEKLPTRMTLIATFATQEHAVFSHELLEVSKNNAQIKIVYTFSGVSKELFNKHISALKKPVYYIVGSEEMVAETKVLLLDLGVAEEKIQTEDFTGY